MESTDANTSIQIVLEKIAIYKMIHEIKREDAKAITSEARMEGLNEIQTLHDEIGNSSSFKDHMIISTKVRWLTYEEPWRGCEILGIMG